ncbi:MAG: phenylalanine 4-monooxygenase [Pseudomonadota bacterium]
MKSISEAAPSYVAHTPLDDGYIAYSDAEHQVWHTLLERQLKLLPGRACDAFIKAGETIGFGPEIPQCAEISNTLRAATGWSVTPVPAIIPADEFFSLLAEKQFPAASFIRRPEDLDYLEEPDIFHELFGHAPHLTDDRFAQFTHAYGIAGLKADERDRELLARLYWFTTEFGLVQSNDGVRAYGAGICSSPGELIYAVENKRPDRRAFDVLDVLRTPFRIDTYQNIYYVIDSFDTLFELAYTDLSDLMRQAKRLGDFKPSWEQ